MTLILYFTISLIVLFAVSIILGKLIKKIIQDDFEIDNKDL